MRPPLVVFLILLTLVAVFAVACRSLPAPSLQDPAGGGDAVTVAGRFSAARAWQDLEALAAIGPRPVGSEGAAKARAYIRAQLEGLGLTVTREPRVVTFGSGEPKQQVELVNLEATIPGASDELVLLIAPYDSAYRENYTYAGVNDGASGAAVLLELARALADRPLPYTTRFYFVDGQAPLGRDGESSTESSLLGSTVVAHQLEDRGLLRSVRLLVHVNRVSDADLRVARDRFSHRIYRDAFWRAAGKHGHRDIFPVTAGFEAPWSGHRSFVSLAMRRTVNIEGTRRADDGTEIVRFTEDDTIDHSSIESLGAVGDAVLAGLRAISASLVKIDRFSKAPTIPAGDVSPKPPAEAETAEPEAPDAPSASGEASASEPHE
jgi:hypothetical protein